MQGRTRFAPFQDPAVFADLLKVRAARLALRWEMGERPLRAKRLPVGPTPIPPGSKPDSSRKRPPALSVFPADAFQQIEAGFARGEVDLETYETARRRRGLM